MRKKGLDLKLDITFAKTPWTVFAGNSSDVVVKNVNLIWTGK